jgi:hypothetical protein
MVSTLRAKSGGVWKGPAADGVISVKKNGAWVSPAYVSAKSNGAWVDSGYRGYPLTPSTPWIHSWDNTSATLQINWSAPPGGAASVLRHGVAELGGDADRLLPGCAATFWQLQCRPGRGL